VCGKPKIEKRNTITRDIKDLPEADLKIITKIDAMGVSTELKEKMKQKVCRKRVSRGFLPTCKCNAPFEAGIVLDPFGGTGTTGITAKQLGYRYVMVEMQPEYFKTINERLESML
jgi:predicted RNA methylase